MEIVTSEEMRRIDRHATRTMRIPSLALMECAGLRVVEAMRHRFPDLRQRRILVLCGKGNNGGDGFVVARHLFSAGFDVFAALAADPRALAGDARTNHLAARGAGVEILPAPTPTAWAAVRRKLADRDLVVDALLGTGLSGSVRGLYAKIVEDVVRSGLPVVAVDIPSGLSGDSTEVPGPALRAVLTVALCRPKLAHLLPPACLGIGALEVVDIGIPPSAVASAGSALFTIEASDLAGILPRRSRNTHKGSFGHLLVVAGSEGKAGAAVLSARAALRAGTGLVTVASPATVRAEVASFSSEIMTVSLPAADAESALDRLLAESSGKSALAVGPGLGRVHTVINWIRRFVTASRLPLVLDADGLNAFEGNLRALTGAGRTLVLTPHPGEMARLLGSSPQEVVKDRIAAARTLARTTRAIVVLKGMATLVATPDGRVFVNRTGNPGMATGGAGDVLTGLIAGLLAQRLDPLKAVLLGVHIHGLAGDLGAAAVGEAGLIAGDILERIPEALRKAAS